MPKFLWPCALRFTALLASVSCSPACQVHAPLTRKGRHVGRYTEVLEPEVGVSTPSARIRFEHLLTKKECVGFSAGVRAERRKVLLNVACLVFSCVFWSTFALRTA